MGALQRPVSKLDLQHFWVYFPHGQRLLYYTWASHWNYCGLLMEVWDESTQTPWIFGILCSHTHLSCCSAGGVQGQHLLTDVMNTRRRKQEWHILHPVMVFVHTSLFPCSSLLWLEQSLPWKGAHISWCVRALCPTPKLGHWDWKQTCCSVYSLVSLCGIGEFWAKSKW